MTEDWKYDKFEEWWNDLKSLGETPSMRKAFLAGCDAGCLRFDDQMLKLINQHSELSRQFGYLESIVESRYAEGLRSENKDLKERILELQRICERHEQAIERLS
jgi:archaellum component FlaC